MSKLCYTEISSAVAEISAVRPAGLIVTGSEKMAKAKLNMLKLEAKPGALAMVRGALAAAGLHM